MFNGKRKQLWNEIADCLCKTSLDTNSGVDTSGDLNNDRRLLNAYGRGNNNCNVRVIKYIYKSLTGYCDGGNSAGLEFSLELCGDCDLMENIYKGFDSFSTKTLAFTDMMECV